MYLPRFALTRRRAALAVLAFGVMAASWPLYSRWREREFRTSLTPWEHYDRAMHLLHPRTTKLFPSGKDPYSMTPGVAELTTEDLKNAIRHLEAIPPDPDVFWRGAEVLPPPLYVRAELLALLRLKRDRPQDYLALEEATYRRCIAKAMTEPAICKTGLREGCAPLAGSERLAQLNALAPIR